MASQTTAPTLDAPAPGTTKRQPGERGYRVFRTYTLAEIIEYLANADQLEDAADGVGPDRLALDACVLVQIGEAEATTPKQARTTVAKLSVPREQLITDDEETGGVHLNAVVESALRTGSAAVRLVEKIV